MHAVDLDPGSSLLKMSGTWNSTDMQIICISDFDSI